MGERKGADRQTVEGKLAGTITRSSAAPEAYATGADALKDMLTKIDEARNEIRAHRTQEAEATLTKIGSTGEALLSPQVPLPDLDVPKIALVTAAAWTLRGRARQYLDHTGEAIEDYHRAIGFFERYIEKAQTGEPWTYMAEIWGYYGVALRGVDLRVRAIDALQKAIEMGSPTPENYRHLGWALKDENRFEEAQKQLEIALEKAPADTVARILLAQTLEQRKLFREAALAYSEAAIQLARSGNLERALELADTALRVDERCATAHAYRGEFLRILQRNPGDLQEAIGAFNRSLDLQPGEAWVMAARGAAQADLGLSEKALQDVNAALQLAPGYVWALELKGRILFDSGSYTEAIEVLRSAIAAEGADESAYNDLAEQLIFQNQPDEALKVIDMALSKFPKAAMPVALRGEALRIQGKPAEALSSFEQALSVDPEFIYAWARKGTVLHELNRDSEALAAFDEALKLNPRYTWALVQKAITRESAGSIDEAIELLKAATQSNQKSAWAWWWLARAQEAAGRLEEALQAADRALAITNDYVDALIIRGEILRRLSRLEEALKALDEAIGIDASNIYAIGTKGQVFRAMAQFEKAIARFKDADEVIPDVAWILEEWADCAEELKRVDEAKQLRDRVLSAKLYDQFDRMAHAEVLAGNGRTEEAVKSLRELLEEKPRFSVGHEVLGRILMEAKSYPEALAALDRAIEIEPTNMLAHAHRGQTLRLVKREIEAARSLDCAVRLNPYLEWPATELTFAYRNLNEPEKALEALDLVLAHNPRPVTVMALKAQVMCDVGEYDEALESADQAIELAPDWSHLYAIKGWNLEYSDRVDQALEAYRKGFEIDENDAWNRRGLADALRRLGSQSEADTHYSGIIQHMGDTVSDAWEFSLIGWCYYGLRRYEQALSFYTEALSLNGNLLSSQFDVAVILAASKRCRPALREFERGLDVAASIGALARRGFLHVALVDLETEMRADPAVAQSPEIKVARGKLWDALAKAREEGAKLWMELRKPAATA